MSSNNGGSRSSDAMKVIVVVSDTSNMNPHTDNSLASEQSTILKLPVVASTCSASHTHSWGHTHAPAHSGRP